MSYETQRIWIVARVRDVNRFAAARSILQRLGEELPPTEGFIDYAEGRPCVYAPQRTYRKTVHGKISDHSRPVVPGYLFVRCDDHPRAWEAVRRAIGVMELMKAAGDADGRPMPVSDDWVLDMRKRELAGEWDEVARIVAAIANKEKERRAKRRRKFRGLQALERLQEQIFAESA